MPHSATEGLHTPDAAFRGLAALDPGHPTATKMISDRSIALAPRRCNPCTLCCVWLPVPAGQIGPGCKPAGIACRHLGPRGCHMYGRRPAVCRGFKCAWLADASWPELWRPDHCGLLCLREWIGGQLPAAAVYEIRADALEASESPQIVAELQRTTAVVALIDFQQRRRNLRGQWDLARLDQVAAAKTPSAA